MAAALVAVVYVITHMSPDKVSVGLEQVGLAPAPGGPPSAAPAPIPDGPLKVNLCKTRVHAILWPDGRKIQEASGGMKARWQAYNLTAADIGSMDVEKWLSLHCEVAASAPPAGSSSAQAAAMLKPWVTFEYIDGSRSVLERAPSGAFRFDGRSFVSPALDQAFADLIKLASLEPTGP